jgi:3-hydroxymyristoyl/3-hydroxydecanoyl-(acyl carrier protein) dehydratase
MTAGELRTTLRVPATHPALRGHFPGRPLVPAVLLLEAAAMLLQEQGLRVVGIERAKFLAPLQPRQAATLRIWPRTTTDWQFAIDRAEMAIARGVLRVAAA